MAVVFKTFYSAISLSNKKVDLLFFHDLKRLADLPKLKMIQKYY